MNMVQQTARPRAPLGTVSYSLLLTMRARRQAARVGRAAGPIVSAAVDAYRETGNQFDGLRAMRAAAHATAAGGVAA